MAAFVKQAKDSIEELVMASCGISDEGASELFKELRNCKVITLIDLNQNRLTDKCFDALA